MKKSKFTDSQIVAILKQNEAGMVIPPKNNLIQK